MAEKKRIHSKALISFEGGEFFARRFRFAAYLTIFLFLILLFRFWHLQLYSCPTLLKMSEKNRIRLAIIPAPRGMILDRSGQILADSRPAFNLFLIPENSPHPSEVLERLTQILGLTPEEAERIKTNLRKYPPFTAIPIRKDLSFEEVALVESEKYWLPGISLEVNPLRWYVHNSLLAHVIGYLSEIDQNELKTLRNQGYRLGDVIGRAGLEKAYEKILRGKAGAARLEIDAEGREIRKISEAQPEPGLNIELTIDLELQKEAENLLENKGTGGAIIMMDPRNGEILAMTSRPTFDPNRFVSGIHPEDWQEILNHPVNPLENRAIRGQYPAGSTFKLVVALAALEEGILHPQEATNCQGSLRLGTRSFRCWRERGHGAVDFHRAIVESCDVYFYRLGLKLGVDRIARTAQALGLGQKTGIELPGEKSGLVPTSQWKLKMLKEPWQPGENLSLAIGQSFLLVTPIQLLNAYAQLANEGKSFEPHLVRKVLDQNGKTILEYLPKIKNEHFISPEHLRLIKDGLKGVVNEPSGTGRAARIPGITVGGKTGTAQIFKQEGDLLRKKELPLHLRDHGWFVAFAPVESPVISVVVLVEHGGHGGSAAAPIAGALLKKYFELYPYNPEATKPLSESLRLEERKGYYEFASKQTSSSEF